MGLKQPVKKIKKNIEITCAEYGLSFFVFF